VCVMKSDASSRVDTPAGAGQVTLPSRPQTLGTAKLTVTLPNWLPYRSTITVNAAAGTASLITRTQDRTIDDSGAGTDANANGILDAGETVNIMIGAKNVGGTTTAGAGSGSRLSRDSRGQVRVGAANYGTLAPSAVSTGTAYRIHVDRAGVLDGDEMQLRLVLTDGVKQWTCDQSVTVRAPVLRHLAQVFTPVGGNLDQTL